MGSEFLVLHPICLVRNSLLQQQLADQVSSPCFINFLPILVLAGFVLFELSKVLSKLVSTRHRRLCLVVGVRKMKEQQWLEWPVWLLSLEIWLPMFYHVRYNRKYSFNCIQSCDMFNNRMAMGILHIWSNRNYLVIILDFIFWKYSSSNEINQSNRA